MTTDTTRFPLPGKAWWEGYDAAQRGLPGAANPYPPGTEESVSWHSGRFEGQAKLQVSAKRRKNSE